MKRNLWSSWSEYLNVSSTDTLEEFPEKLVPQASDVMKLQLKDMNLFGYCSEYDDFYLVICEICGKCVKPQSLNLHIEFRHNINLHKLSLPESVQETPLLTYATSNCSSENSKNEDKLSKINSESFSVSRTEGGIIMNSKRQEVYVQPYPKPCSINSSQEKIFGKLTSYSPSSDMARTPERIIKSEKRESLKNNSVRKMSSESSLSTCDSQTSMTVLLNPSFLMPNMKLCDIKEQCSNHLHCVNSKTLPKNDYLSKATVLSQVFPEKRIRQSIQSAKQGSQVHHLNEEIVDWNSMQSSTNLSLNGMTCAAWNQQSHFRPLPHGAAVGKTEQIHSHSFNCSDLKKFGDLETQVLIHNAAMGT